MLSLSCFLTLKRGPKPRKGLESRIPRQSFDPTDLRKGRMYVCLFVCLFVYMFVCLSVCMFVCLSVCLFVCLSVCLFVCFNEMIDTFT